MRRPEEQNIALECLKLATEQAGSTEDILSRATAYYAFVSAQTVDAVQAFIDAVK